MEANKQPLVSVPVITYNSAKYVLETLESIKAQTYQNIELIISDDCSTDNTVELCRRWIEHNKDRFVRTHVITSNINTGISANLNRAESMCNGEWIKEVAGDDILFNDSIESCLNYSLKNNVKCLFGNIEAFGKDEEYAQYLTKTFTNRHKYMSSLSVDALYEMIINGVTPAAPGFFYMRQFFIDNNITNDVRIPMIEDVPKWLKILKTGYMFHFMDKNILKYRLGGVSTSIKWNSPHIYTSQRKLYFYYQFEYLYKNNKKDTIDNLLAYEIDTYIELYNSVLKVYNSKSYKLGKLILSPIRKIRSIWKNILN